MNIPASAPSLSPVMESGYCYEFDGDGSLLTSSDENWDIEVYVPTGRELWVSKRKIDGSTCMIFKCCDGRYRAQTREACVPAPTH